MKGMNAKEMYSLYEANELRKEKSVQDRKDKENEEKDKTRKSIDDIDKKTEEGVNKAKNKEKAQRQLKESLLAESLYQIYNKALGQNGEYLVEGDELKRRSIVNNFVHEQNVDRLLREFKTKSLLLSEYSNIIDSYYKTIVEKAKITEEIIIEPDEKDQFIEDISNEEADKVVKIVADRVLDAVQQFIISNQEDKQNIMNILSAAQEKIDGTVKTNLQEAYTMDANRQISKIRNTKYKSILEFIIEKIGKEAYVNENAKSFLTADKKLNMSKIMESVVEIYTLLETINTMNIIKIDDDYIKEFCTEF